METNANPSIRFIVFEYDGHYPNGGTRDIARKCGSLDEAISIAVKSSYEFIEVYDTWTGEAY